MQGVTPGFRRGPAELQSESLGRGYGHTLDGWMACTLRWMVGWLIMLYVRLPAVAIAHAIRVPAVAIAMAGTHHAPLLLGVTRRVFSFLGVCVVVLSDLAFSEGVGRVCLRARINLNLNLAIRRT